MTRTYTDNQEAYQLYLKGIYAWEKWTQSDMKGLSGSGYESAKLEDLKTAFAKSGIMGFYQKVLEQEKAVPQTQQNRPEIAELYARLGEKEAAFEWLEKAYAAHDDEIVRLKEQLGYDNLRSDPRFADLLRRVGLPQ